MKSAILSKHVSGDFLAFGVILFVATFVAFHEYFAKIFYLVILLFFAFAYRNKSLVMEWGLNSIPVLFFLIYFAISSVWGDGSVMKHLKYVVYVYVFYLAVAIAWEGRAEEIKYAFVIGCLVNLVVSLAFDDSYRLKSFFGPENVIDFAGVLFMGVLVSISLILDSKDFRVKCALALITVFLLAGALLTKSRSPLIGMACALTVLLFKYKKTLIVSAAILLAAAFEAGVLSRAAEGVYSGGPIRFYTWAHAYDLAMQSPFFGMGYGSEFYHYFKLTGEQFRTTHSVYFGTFFYGGVVGVFFLGWMLVKHAKLAVSFSSENRFPCALLVYGLIHVSGQGIGLLYHPHQTWIVFWFPMAVVLGAWMKNSVRYSLFTSRG